MIEIRNISKTYDNGSKALKDIDIRIQDGEFVFIMGRSGSGKSTLIRLLLKEAEPTSGRIVVNDMDLQKMPRRYIPKYRRRLGVVFQDFRLLKDRTVFEYKSKPNQLSGGEQQRVAIARALINRPEVLLADEPTGNLDHENAAEIMKLLERINALGTTVVVVTHSQEMVAEMNKRVITMDRGEVVRDEGGSGI